MTENKSYETSSPDVEVQSFKTSSKKTMMKPRRYIGLKILYKTALIFMGYAICYMEWSFILLFVAAASLIWLENRDKINSNKITVKATACSFTKEDIVKRIDEIPSWVKFPDRERAEWLNQIIRQIWPTINSYVVKIFRTSLQSKIRKKFDTFQFENIDFGQTPPKIDGIKVYNTTSTRDSIIVDFDVFYDGDCDINFSVSGTDIGGIRDFQLSVEVRVVLKPLLLKMPIIGGIQVYFLNSPDINFTLDGLSSIPGLSSFLRTKIEEKITKLLVYPNKITKRFSKSVAPSELKALEPAGVLRVHVFEAKDLMAKDITGKSDPYAILYVGAQKHRTNTINQNLNPKWDYWCEFVILDPLSQHLGFELFDKDNVNEDDFLGSGEINIKTIIKGDTDQWIKLNNAKHGSIHLRFTWLGLSEDVNDLDAIREETQLLKVDNISRAVLIIYVEMATNLPYTKLLIKPDTFFYLSIGDHREKSKVKKHTNDPVWDQGFVFLVPNPLENCVQISIMDKAAGHPLTHFSYKISELMKKNNLEISKTEFTMDNEESTIILSMQLRILTNQLYEMEDEDSDSDSDETFSRQNSVDDTSVRLRNPPQKVIEENISTSSISTVSASSNIGRSSSSNSFGNGLGSLELSFNYNEPRQKLLVTVHRLSNLPLKHPDDIPDPYVKIKMMLQDQKTSPTQRTKVLVDSCDPVFEETFEYSFSKSDAYEQTVMAVVKTKKFLHNNTIGQVTVHLKYVNLNEPYRAWFPLYSK